jgi:hypothetical protein
MDSKDVADVLMDCIIVALCQGKTLIPVQDFQYNLAYSIFALSHREFVKNSLEEKADVSF